MDFFLLKQYFLHQCCAHVVMLYVNLEEHVDQQAVAGQDENIPDRSHFRLLAQGDCSEQLTAW